MGKKKRLEQKEFTEAVKWIRPWMDPQTFQGLVEVSERPWLRQWYCRRGEIGLEALLEGSKTSARDWDALKIMVTEDLQRGDRVLPPALAEWVVDQIEGKAKRPTRRGPEPSQGAEPRREYIAEMIAAVCARFDTYATRKGGEPACCPAAPYGAPKGTPDGGSAADVVGEAFGIGYKTVERAWRARPHN